MKEELTTEDLRRAQESLKRHSAKDIVYYCRRHGISLAECDECKEEIRKILKPNLNKNYEQTKTSS